MGFVNEVRRRLAVLLHRDRFHDDLVEEMHAHIEMQAEENQEEGMAANPARYSARRRFGNTAVLAETSRSVWGWGWLERVGQDVRFAFRMMRKSPGFTVVAILSLALGIGGNTIVFSTVNSLLLRPLPVASPDQLYFVNRNGGPSQSFPNYKDIRDRNTVFSSLFMYRVAAMSVESTEGARRVWGFLVTGNYFETLGIRPALGRFFGPREDQHVNASPHAVLSYACWQNRFGGDPQIAGRVVRINTHPYTVVGVAPKGFHGTEVFYWPELWVPLTMQPQIEGATNPWLESRGSFNGWVAGRLKPDVTPQQADANLKVVADQLTREHRLNEGMRLTVSRPGFVGAMLRGPIRAFAGGVLLLACLVLLAACANVASLLTARVTDRRRELAIRASIGAGRGRIVRQLVTESVVLSMGGGLAGITIAVLLLRLLSQWQAPLDFPVQFDVNPDLRVFAFALAVAVNTGLLFGTVPALRAWRADPNQSLKAGTAPAPGRRWALRDALLAVQVALCCLLVTASFLALRGLVQTFQTPLGFVPSGAVVVGYDLALSGYSEESGRGFHERALEAVSRIPGVEGSAYSSSVPLSIDQSNTGAYPEETVDFRPKNRIGATFYRVSPGYFRAMGTKLLRGREFTIHDGPRAPPVAIVNEALARKLLRPGDWVGQRFRWDRNTIAEVVAVVEDGKYETLTEASKPVIFQPILRYYSSTAVIVARSSRPEADVAADMRRALAEVDPHLPLYGVGSLTQMLGLVYLPANAAVISLGAFGILAMMLAVSGIYGLSAYSVAQRVREIGIRVAIGASPSNVLRLVFGRAAILVATGSAAGLALGALASKVLSSVVLGVSPRDPVVLAGAALTMGCIGIGAIWSPVRRALRVDPVQALRQE
jgi:predicted permease